MSVAVQLPLMLPLFELVPHPTVITPTSNNIATASFFMQTSFELNLEVAIKQMPVQGQMDARVSAMGAERAWVKRTGRVQTECRL